MPRKRDAEPEGPEYALVDLSKERTGGPPKNNDNIQQGDPERQDENEKEKPSVYVEVISRIAAIGIWAVIAAFAATLVFGLVYLVAIKNEVDYYERMTPTACNVTAHNIDYWITPDDGSPVKISASLSVWYKAGDQDSIKTGKLDLKPRGWLTPSEKDALFARYPVGATMLCYYSRENGAFLALNNGEDKMRTRIGWGIAIASVVFAVCFVPCLLAWVIATVELCLAHRRQRRIETL